MSVGAAECLTFEPAGHIYRHAGTGRRVPSVTQILTATRISQDFEALADIIGADTIEEKRAIGSAVHADAHSFDDDDLEWDTVDVRVRPYLEAWAAFRANHPQLVPMTRERMVYHPGLFYCGTLDGVFLDMARQRRVLIDIKCGDPASAGGQFQTAAYALAWSAEYPDEPVHDRQCVQLTPGRRVPYRVHPYPEWRDEQKWRAFVTTYHEQFERRAHAGR